MKRIALFLLLAGCASDPVPAAPPPAAASAKAPGVPAAVATEGVPPIPDEITQRLAQYHSARSASFQDFGPDGSILIATRFAETSQLHLVPFPGGRREQITFTEEPVGGVFIPGTSDLLYTQARGGDENYQVYRLDRKQGRSILLSDGKSRNSLGPISRKGDKVVVSSNRRNGRDTDLYLLHSSKGTTSPLFQTKGTFWGVTDWAPDDTALMMVKVVSVNDTRPFTLRLDNPVPEPLVGFRRAPESPAPAQNSGTLA